MQVQSSDACSASGYSTLQSAGRRPEDTGAPQNGQQGGVQANSDGGNQPTKDPGATRGRIVNITA